MKTDTTTDHAATAATRAKRPIFPITFAAWYVHLAGFSMTAVTPIRLDRAGRGRVRDLLAPGDAKQAA